MVDNPERRGAEDRTRIALGEEHEVRYWTEALGVTREELRDAVGAVGHHANDVREYFEKNRREAGAR